MMDELLVRQYVKQFLPENGKEFTIAFLGGSLSKGEMVKKERCFVSLFEKQIADVPGMERPVSVLRYGESGTLSANGLFKLGDLIGEKPDLVFVDYAMNDPGDRYLWETTEGICYQLCEAGIGVVILLFCNEQGSCTRGAMERAASHYGLPVYDIGQRIYTQIRDGKLTWEDYAQDYVHPTELGHKMIADYLLRIFYFDDLPVKAPGLSPLPSDPAFQGALRRTSLLDLSEDMKDAGEGETIFSRKIMTTMILMEFWQDCIPNDACAVVFLDGKKVATAEACAGMAWGNPVSRYIGGDGELTGYELTVIIGNGKPPAGWDYSKLRLRFLLGGTIA